MRNDRCEVCVVWDRLNSVTHKKPRGLCRRKSPIVRVVRGKERTVWPKTHPHEFCGEFVRKQT